MKATHLRISERLRAASETAAARGEKWLASTIGTDESTAAYVAYCDACRSVQIILSGALETADSDATARMEYPRVRTSTVYADEPEDCCNCHSNASMPLVHATVADRSFFGWLCHECGYVHEQAHTQDSHCTVVDGECIVCGVSHRVGCSFCGGAGFHKDGCSQSDATETRS